MNLFMSMLKSYTKIRINLSLSLFIENDRRMIKNAYTFWLFLEVKKTSIKFFQDRTDAMESIEIKAGAYLLLRNYFFCSVNVTFWGFTLVFRGNKKNFRGKLMVKNYQKWRKCMMFHFWLNLSKQLSPWWRLNISSWRRFGGCFGSSRISSSHRTSCPSRSSS